MNRLTRLERVQPSPDYQDAIVRVGKDESTLEAIERKQAVLAKLGRSLPAKGVIVLHPICETEEAWIQQVREHEQSQKH